MTVAEAPDGPEPIVGTPGNDVLVGSPGDDVIPENAPTCFQLCSGETLLYRWSGIVAESRRCKPDWFSLRGDPAIEAHRLQIPDSQRISKALEYRLHLGAECVDGDCTISSEESLPGFGEQKAKIFLALLGKQYGVTPDGWRKVAGDYGKDGSYLSIADVVDAGSLEKVRNAKKQAKAQAKAAKG